MAQYCHISAGSDNYEARSSKNIPPTATIWSRECHGIVLACHNVSHSVAPDSGQTLLSDMAQYVGYFPLTGGTDSRLCYHCLPLTKHILNTMSQAPPLIDESHKV